MRDARGGPRVRSIFWPDHDAELRHYAEVEKLTTAEAAHRLGVTKNAVIGRGFRLRLKWEHSSKPPELRPIEADIYDEVKSSLRPANMDRLKERIARPDFDKHLIPLLLYRGNASFGKIQRLWNFAITMMESDATTLSDIRKLQFNADYTHLVGPVAPLKAISLYSILGRLRDNPKVTDNIPGFTKYLRDGVEVREIRLDRIPVDSPNKVRVPWRNRIYIKSKQAGKLWTPRSVPPRAYPYLIHKPNDGDSERAMMLAVNAAVPKGLPDFIRADICQDIIVAILCGDMQMDELQGSVRQYTNKILRMHPIKYGDLSLDAQISTDDDRTFGDILSEASSRGLEW